MLSPDPVVQAAAGDRIGVAAIATSSPRAALIYLHATRERAQKIASGMGKLFADP
jgi:hypothetical protein